MSDGRNTRWMEKAAFRTGVVQMLSGISAFLICLDSSRFICNVNNLMCPLTVMPSSSPSFAP
ncbi:MAG TPA: hypothetical protein PKK11_02545 [Methanothrix sp.]|nr:hypothetical protein [Methanothrix sp.]HPT18949.1 hypothetical protein [Methanothrix sp.]